MLTRRFLLGAAPALLVAKPTLATSVCTLGDPAVPIIEGDPQPTSDPDKMRRLRSAWEYFAYSADAIVEGALGWHISGASGRDGRHLIHFARVDLDVDRSLLSAEMVVERHTRIWL